jgi:hypothetical protein
VLRVPLAELEEAARLSASDALARHTRTQNKNKRRREHGGRGRPLPLAHLTEGEDASSGGAVGVLERRSRAPPTPTPEEEKKWVEIGVFTDPSLYSRMEAKFPNDTAVKLRQYVTTLVNTVGLGRRRNQPPILRLIFNTKRTNHC